MEKVNKQGVDVFPLLAEELSSTEAVGRLLESRLRAVCGSNGEILLCFLQNMKEKER